MVLYYCLTTKASIIEQFVLDVTALKNIYFRWAKCSLDLNHALLNKMVFQRDRVINLQGEKIMAQAKWN
jgi:hypothetical protein